MFLLLRWRIRCLFSDSLLKDSRGDPERGTGSARTPPVYVSVFCTCALTCVDACLRSSTRLWTSRAGTTRSAPVAAAARPPQTVPSRPTAPATGAGVPARSGRCSQAGTGSTATAGSWWPGRPGSSTWPWSSSCSPAASSLPLSE